MSLVKQTECRIFYLSLPHRSLILHPSSACIYSYKLLSRLGLSARKSMTHHATSSTCVKQLNTVWRGGISSIPSGNDRKRKGEEIIGLVNKRQFHEPCSVAYLSRKWHTFSLWLDFNKARKVASALPSFPHSLRGYR